MKRKALRLACLLLLLLAVVMLAACGEEESEVRTLTNVSYDPTRELYAAYNQLFAEHYLAETGEEVELIQSHGGSGSQETGGSEEVIITG